MHENALENTYQGLGSGNAKTLKPEDLAATAPIDDENDIYKTYQ